ncbi:heterokaryon incompatibility protein [Colletotrichum karsti]|uniref:Heterokaryon incompatibility protein n=1 Tax=Colletotrichum karsti TaxID=1095194 RepID=A0A9P6IBN4_9PEZI|nr:heterokaryon incompatibility protein [Colletotrichum karsti]KAF9879665.1 heterokaryon incompatibility protein [Colletotrichum karsti]
MSLAKMWIKRCTTNHEKCRILPPASPRIEQQWYPTRLLEVGPLTEESPWCRLILPQDTPIQGPYMTLSHCWGLAHCMSLTTDNYAQLLKGIPLEDLPQLYKDALYVAAQIGIRYMWIDSLCIIQKGDDLADWRQEAGLMNQVYSKSFCTVSAACARDSTESMFNNLNPDLIHPQIVQLRVAGKDVPHLVSEPKFWNMEVNRALINTRAWVFQERILSSRVLYFGKDQIFWECQQQDAAEIYPDGTSAYVVTGTPRFRGAWPDYLSHRSADEDEELRKHVQWVNLVTEYSSNNITFAKDKLIALSAIAKTHMAWNGDQYLAGLWRKWLEWELSWSVTRPLDDFNAMAVCRCNPLPKKAEYRAPSWSWASADRPVNPGLESSQSHDLLIEVEDVHLDYVTADITGLVSGGWVDVWGVLKKLELIPHALKGVLFWELVVNGISIEVPTFAETQMEIRFDDTERNFQEMENPSELYCLPAAVERDGGIYGEQTDALVLEPHDAARGIFRRIGVAYSEVCPEKILVRNANEGTLPCVRYENGRHLIRII